MKLNLFVSKVPKNENRICRESKVVKSWVTAQIFNPYKSFITDTALLLNIESQLQSQSSYIV